MSTEEDQGAKATTSTIIAATASVSSFGEGGGGAGGKFRKKPLRRQTTPYDRPLTALRGNNETSTSWLSKLVVDPASKLISYGAQRLFGSVFRKRLPPPPPPQPPELDHDLSGGLQTAVFDDENGEQRPGGGECSEQVNISCGNVMTELEQLVKQRTFTKSEIDHLTTLLHSRTVEASTVHDSRRNEEMVSRIGKYQEYPSGSLEENRNEKTPVVNRKALEDDIASPAELAKAYMGSRPSKVSPSMLAMRSQVVKEENTILASKSPISPMANWTSVTNGALENGIITPKSRGRLGTSIMARSPYSRIHPSSTLKQTVIGNNGYSDLPLLSSHSSGGHNESLDLKPMILKRSSSVLEDEIGSVGPVRRIRQKPNLLVPRIPHSSHAIGSRSGAKQKLPLIDEPKHNASVTVAENNGSVPSTSYARVHSKSSEVAARILQHLEKLSPTENSSRSKPVVSQESPFRLTPNMLHGKALRSMEDMNSSKLFPHVGDGQKLEDRSNATLPNASDSTSQKPEKVKENGLKESGHSDAYGPVSQTYSGSSLEPSSRSFPMPDSVIANSISQPQKKRAFRMSAQEDSTWQDDDMNCNGHVTQVFFEGKRPTKPTFLGQKREASEEPNSVDTTVDGEVKSTSGLASIKPEGFVSTASVKVGEGRTEVPFSRQEKASAFSRANFPPFSSVAALDKPNEPENPPAFGTNSKVADKFPVLPLESSGKILESAPGSSIGLVSVASPVGSYTKMAQPDENVQFNPVKDGDRNGTSNNVPSAISNGLLATSSPPISFSVASLNDATQVSSSNVTHTTSPFGISDITSSSTTVGFFRTSIGSISGPTAASSTTAGPVFKFGAVVDRSASVSATATTKVSESANLIAEDDSGPTAGSSGNASSSVPALIPPSTGNSTATLGSSSDANKLQQNSLFTANKPFVFGAGFKSQGTSTYSTTTVPFSSVSMSSSTGFGSSLSNSQGFYPSKSLGFSMPTSLSATDAILSSSGCAPSAASISVYSAPGSVSFGLGSSSASAIAVGSSTTGGYSFTSSSLSSSPAVISASSFSGGTNGMFGFGTSSASATPTNPIDASSTSFNASNSGSEAPKSSVFGSFTNFPSPSTGFSFSTSSISASNPATSMVFNASTGASSGMSFSFTAAAASVSSSPSPSFNLPTFGNPASVFPFSSGNNDQTNTEDSMAEDTVPSTPSFLAPSFGQSAISPPSIFPFGSTPSHQSSSFTFSGQQAQVRSSNPFGVQQTQVAQPNPSLFGGLQTQVAPPNPSPFNSSGSLDFAPGGGFSLGSGDKSGRKIVRVNRNNKNRKR